LRKPLVQKFLAAAGQHKGLGADYFCDAAILAGAGIPSVVFGPGDIAHAHTDDEWVTLDALEAAKNLLLKFFHSLP
jgi:acetylornithine deacetylase/succinyl-diaminopimelate desuccinylase-like protein